MTTPQSMKTEFAANFNDGKPLTAKQLWTITKFAKYVRLRARNNAAFNNLANTVFGPDASFKTVTKTRVNRFNGQPESYPGLSIVVNGEAVEGEEE